MSLRKKLLVAVAGVAGVAGLIACATLVQRDGETLPAVSSRVPAEPGLGADLEPILGSPEPRTYYQYVDKKGIVRFTESLDRVPKAWRDRAGQVELNVPPPEEPAAGRMVRKLRAARDAQGSDL